MDVAGDSVHDMQCAYWQLYAIGDRDGIHIDRDPFGVWIWRLKHKEDRHNMALYPDLVIALVHWMMVDIISYYASCCLGEETADLWIFWAIRVGAAVSIILSIIAYRVVDEWVIWLIAGIYFGFGMVMLVLCEP